MVSIFKEQPGGCGCFCDNAKSFTSLLYFHKKEFNLNKLISNGKRFIAYEVVKRLKTKDMHNILEVLHAGVTSRESKKGQKHKVFEESFDAKPLFTDSFLYQKIDYIHHNPVRGKWQLVEDYRYYPHSSASFYELQMIFNFEPKHHNDLG